jgi:hypothetical protein
MSENVNQMTEVEKTWYYTYGTEGIHHNPNGASVLRMGKLTKITRTSEKESTCIPYVITCT